MADHAPATGLIHQLSVLGNEGRHLRLDGLGQQPTGTDTQNLGQRVLN
jgi:hypothetical protein